MTSKPKWFDINEIEADKEVVEDEVLDALEEGKEEANDIVVDVETGQTRPPTPEEIDKDPLQPEVVEFVIKDIPPVSKETKEVLRKVGTGEYKIPEPRKYPGYMIRDLRRADRYFNRTCATCARRVPLNKIKGGKGEECDECREK